MAAFGVSGIMLALLPPVLLAAAAARAVHGRGSGKTLVAVSMAKTFSTFATVSASVGKRTATACACQPRAAARRADAVIVMNSIVMAAGIDMSNIGNSGGAAMVMIRGSRARPHTRVASAWAGMAARPDASRHGAARNVGSADGRAWLFGMGDTRADAP